jgi:hypothetical protein
MFGSSNFLPPIFTASLHYHHPTRNDHGLTKLAGMAPRGSLLHFLQHLMAVVDNFRHRILSSHREHLDLHGLR